MELLPTYFTIQEANAVLPAVIQKYKALQQQRAEVQKLEAQLNSSMGMSFNLGDYATLKKQLNSAVTKFYAAVEELENSGAVLKSLEEGLLDFPSKRFDEDVWLCWKEGETEIKFWHEKDVGFMGRKPLSVSDESLV